MVNVNKFMRIRGTAMDCPNNIIKMLEAEKCMCVCVS